jgi:ubiquinone/menaquinone biosynthesis C-methylase UbiE
MSRSHFHPDESERRRSQEPFSILRLAGLQEGMVFIDMGCGQGFFTMPAAEIVGSKGKVYAIDVDPASIEKVEERASEKGLKNIVVKAARAEEVVLFDSKADMVFFANSFHDFEDKAKVLGNSWRMLKGGGRVVDLDWKRKDTIHGPPLWKRLTAEEVQGLMSDAGFSLMMTMDCGKQHYLILGNKT